MAKEKTQAKGKKKSPPNTAVQKEPETRAKQEGPQMESRPPHIMTAAGSSSGRARNMKGAQQMLGNTRVSQMATPNTQIQRRGNPTNTPQPQTITRGTRGQWRRDADRAIRTHFGLSGPGMTSSRVRFLSQTQFAQQVPGSEMTEILLNLFYSPPAGSRIQDILRYHHMAFATLRRLRQFIQDRIQTGYFEYQLVSPPNITVQCITPRELIAQNIGGFTTTQSARSSRRVLLQQPANVETLVHEGCHFYVHNKFKAFANSPQNADRIIFGLRLSQILMEGFAEYFARQVMRANHTQFGPIAINAYQPEVTVVERLVVTLREQDARDAYFKGDTAALNRLEQAIAINERTNPDLLVPDFMIP